MSQKLPERPNLDQLKKQAKSLLRAAEQRDADALARFAILPAFSKMNAAELGAAQLALHDAQSVIAREHGFPSWNALREEVEARTLSFEAAVEEFIRCATGGGAGRAQRLLALFPAVAPANLYTALVLGDADAANAHLREHPELATKAGGPLNWEPLLYVCHTSMHEGRTDGLVAIARRLCELGANPNAEYHWNWHAEIPRTVLWAALCVVRHLPLAEALLEAGANPTDGVSAHIAGGVGYLPALDLLDRFRMNPNGAPGGVPPLVHILLWATDAAGPLWLLEHGADPNLAWGDDGEAPLHVAARRWDLALVERLVTRGADVKKRRKDGFTPHTLAELNGNHDIAEWLLAHGAIDELSSLERFIAACARGDEGLADSMLAASPQLRADLRHEHHLMLHRPAESGNAPVLEAMLKCGFDPAVADKDKVTALHKAAMRVKSMQCVCCCRTALPSTRSTACSRRSRSFGLSKAGTIHTVTAAIMSPSRVCLLRRVLRWTGRRLPALPIRSTRWKRLPSSVVQRAYNGGHQIQSHVLTYESARPWAKAMKAAVVTRKMPPWFADPQFGHFANDPSVTHHICVYFKPHTPDVKYNTPVWSDRPRDDSGIRKQACGS